MSGFKGPLLLITLSRFLIDGEALNTPIDSQQTTHLSRCLI